MKLGQRVVFERARRWSSRDEFGVVAGLSARLLDDLETGNRSNYRPDTLARIESALGWTEGSALRFVNGGRITYDIDPQLQRVIDRWDALPVEFRKIVDSLTEVATRR